MSQRKVSTTHATAEQQSEQKICNEQVAATFYIPANTKKIKEKEAGNSDVLHSLRYLGKHYG